MTKEVQMTNDENFPLYAFELRVSSFILHSSLVIRHYV